MPFPNEHACRLTNPDQYDSFARENGAGTVDGKPIDHIFGIKDGSSELQAIRYPTSDWSASDARSHCQSRDSIEFEAASNENYQTVTEHADGCGCGCADDEKLFRRRQSCSMATNASADTAEVREVTREGRDYLVFPIIAAREMVLNYPETGTKELLPVEHLAETHQAWAGKPLVYIHPQNAQSTASKAESFAREVIGSAFSPEMVGDRLRVQGWVDIEKALSIGGTAQEVVRMLRNNEQLGVSTGYATIGDELAPGTHEGEQYDLVQGTVVPDHIAIFPPDKFHARCSPEDGCAAPRLNFLSDGDSVTDDDSEDSTANAHADEMGLETGSFVKWQTEDGMAHGVVIDTKREGAFEVDGETVAVPDIGSDFLVLVQHFTESGEPADDRSAVLFSELMPWYRPKRENTISDEEVEEAVANAHDSDMEVDDQQAATLGRRVLNAFLGVDNASTEGAAVENASDEESGDDPPDEGEREQEPDDGEEETGTETETTETDTMSDEDNDFDIEALAEQSAFDVDQLEEWDEDDLTALSETVDSTAEEESEETEAETGEEEAEQSTSDETGESTEESGSTEDLEREVEELRTNVSELKDLIEEQQNEEKRPRAERVANAVDGLNVNAAMELDEDVLAELENEHVEPRRINAAAVPGSMDREPTTGPDPDEYPGGTRSEWEKRQEADN